MDKNLGFDLTKEYSDSSEEDYQFGASTLPDLAYIPEDEREKYFSEGEVQKAGREDTMSCASFGPCNILEAKFNYLIANEKISRAGVKWLADNGYLRDGKMEVSDAYIAILSDTRRTGNSLKAPLEAIRKNGLVPKSTMPLAGYESFDDYHDKARITEGIKELGQEFTKRFYINYEKVLEEDFPEVLKKDILDIALYAWGKPVNGVYTRTERQPNHVCTLYKRMYNAHDSYLDRYDGDFNKELAPDFKFYKYGYRLTINEVEVQPLERCWIKKFLADVKKFYIYL